MKVEIDQSAGFCFGVDQAIKKAEQALSSGLSVYSLGEIVHNPAEVKRLESLGLKPITHTDFRKLKNVTVLIRAHGEPPETYNHAKVAGITLIEATCPIVLKLHDKIHRLKSKNPEAQIVIAGKKDHPEIKGLIGHAGPETVVIEDKTDLLKPDFTKPIHLFVQTTMSTEKLTRLQQELHKRLEMQGEGKDGLILENRLCGQVANRAPRIKSFCKKYDVIIFVSGKNSSNGRSLFEQCKSVHPKSYMISAATELRQEWFKGAESTGVSGATSTPQWLLQQIAQDIKAMV